MKTLNFIVLLFLATACAMDTNTKVLSSESPTGDFSFLDNLSSEDSEALMPNDLFKAVYNNQEDEQLRTIIDNNAEYLLETNSEGDTPLGFAIKSHLLDQALFLLKQTDPSYYLHQNELGESYLYLASQNGFVDFIITLSNLFYERQKGFFINYEFSDLDLINNEGERALHVAKNAAVAETLSAEYNRGFLEFPLRKFQLLQNNQGQSFLHTAVRDQNEDLLRWGLQENCSQSDGFWAWTWEGVQSFSSMIDIDFDYLLNTKDNQGLTVLNFSAKISYLEGIEILSSCPWTDYLSKDNEGNTALQNFLLSLDPLRERQDEELRHIFLRLSQKQSLLSFNSLSKNINSINNKGENSLHIAASLNDPYFYNQLKIHGNKEIENNDGKTAEQIFENHQNSIRLY